MGRSKGKLTQLRKAFTGRSDRQEVCPEVE